MAIAPAAPPAPLESDPPVSAAPTAPSAPKAAADWFIKSRPAQPTELRFVPWLQSLDPADREFAVAQLRVATVSAGKYVCHAGTRPMYWIGVLDGLVKMSGASADGSLVTFAGFPSGGWFGEGTVLKHEAYRYDIQTLRPSLLAALPVAAFTQLLDNSIGFNRFLMLQLNERLGQFIGAKAADLTLPVDERVARAIATLFDPALFPNVGPVLKIGQQELAYLVGVSRQRINQAMPLLRAAGAVSAEYGGIRLLDLKRLQNYRSPG